MSRMDMNAIEVASCAYGQASRPPDATKNRKDGERYVGNGLF